MLKNDHALLTARTIDCFILRPGDVFNVSHLPDFGRHICASFDGRKKRTFIMSLIDYSMPYIKHNRLSMPGISHVTYTELCGLMKIILACLVGIYPHCNRRPTWEIRVELFVTFHELCSHGKKSTLYDFCQKNLCLLRVAIIEYYVYFISTNLPIEMKISEDLFESRCAMIFVFDSINFNVDNFRQLALQVKCDWKTINDAAVVVVERLNRVCKGKLTRTVRSAALRPSSISKRKTCCYQVFHKHDRGFVQEAYSFPRFAHVKYAKGLISPHGDVSLEFLRDVNTLTAITSTSALPFNLKHAQITAYKEYLAANGPLGTKSSVISFCVRCAVSREKGGMFLNMRCADNDVVSCGTCKSADSIISINTLGRIIRILDQYFFFCSTCFNVHEWMNNGREFAGCDMSSICPVETTSKNCCLCSKHFCDVWSVFDDRLGIMHDVRLCKWHCPDDHFKSCIYNLSSLWNCVRERTKSKRSRLTCSY